MESPSSQRPHRCSPSREVGGTLKHLHLEMIIEQMRWFCFECSGREGQMMIEQATTFKTSFLSASIELATIVVNFVLF